MTNTLIHNLSQIIFSISVFLNAALFLPQALIIYKTKNSKSISISTFAGFNFVQFFTAIHGYIIKDYVLMLGFSLSFLICGFITILAVLYRKKYKV